ncbi:TatD family hydrolase [Flavobacterium palustre]|uniref:TatD family hydrolase n=1 Tax=Flavobacterium palustre TaxID=1476463 RepID=A0ABQ1HQR2_9FLAO|nr:TatD family hydrolase [Flavobacterium palustre]GGA85220.1 TatD family hydrolase [Flavobacterium palustre]
MQYFNLHTHQFKNQEHILELVNQYPQEFDQTITNYSIGIHPLFIDENRLESDLEILEQKAGLPECLAIGECGLDKRSETSFEIQLEGLKRQFLLAEKFQKPLVIHCVHAFQELVEIKNQLQITVPIIIHGFSKKEQLAKQLLNNGFYLSFGRYLLVNPELESVFNNVPENRFFLETDTSDYTIEEVYALAAKYKKITVTELQQIISNNFNTVFNK